MYHYVRPDPEAFPAYYHLSLEDFRRQLDHFEDEYGIVDRETFLATLRGDIECPDGVVLTFDDGLTDHAEHVLPELERRGLWGIFYVSTGPYQQEGVLNVHRIHAMLGQYGGERTLEALRGVVSDDMIDADERERFREYTYTTQEESAATRVKRILNYFLSYEHRSTVLDSLESKLPDAACSVPDLYLTTEQLESLHEADMTVGSHSVTHRLLSKLDAETQMEEIESSFQHLETVLGTLDPKTFCYPYGGKRTYTEDTLRALEDIGCEWAFSVEPRDITTKDLRSEPQQLPRYDCNEFPHGGASGAVE
jgi:peptidoglycan/xylan/chitin deacetylase (PgdA/CDA1 family)